MMLDRYHITKSEQWIIRNQQILCGIYKEKITVERNQVDVEVYWPLRVNWVSNASWSLVNWNKQANFTWIREGSKANRICAIGAWSSSSVRGYGRRFFNSSAGEYCRSSRSLSLWRRIAPQVVAELLRYEIQLTGHFEHSLSGTP